MLKHIIFILSEEYYAFIAPKENLLKEKTLLHETILCLISSESFHKNPCRELTSSERLNTLFITDAPDIFVQIQQMGAYIIALYHEHNRNCSFPGALYAVEDIFQLEYRSYDEAYRRLAGIPWDILKTERLLVRESMLSDIPSFYKIYREPSITVYTEALYEDPQEEAAYLQDYIKQVYGFYGFGIWTVLLKETGQIIGRAGLNVREGYDLPELGFVIDTSHQKQGFAYEVCSAILTYAKEELLFERVQAFVQKENLPSRKLLEKLGFSYEREACEKGQNYMLYFLRLAK